MLYLDGQYCEVLQYPGLLSLQIVLSEEYQTYPVPAPSLTTPVYFQNE